MSDRVGVQVIIQARVGSSRLPGKILMSFVGDYTFLEWLIARARLSKNAKRVVVATSASQKDDAVEAACARAGALCFRGSEDDVLGRFRGAMQLFPCDIVAQVNGDEPLADIPEMDRTVNILKKEHLDYANNHPAGLPLGTGSEAYTSAAFTRMAQAAETPYDHEHVTSYFYHHTDLFRQREVAPLKDHAFAPHARLTLDTAEDLIFLRALALAMGFSEPQKQPTTDEILSYLQSHPELVAINKNVVQKTFPQS